MKSSKKPSRLCAAFLSLTIPAVAAADYSGITGTTSGTASDMATTTLQGLSSVLGDVNGVFSAFGSQSGQMQTLANQLMKTQQGMSGLGQQQSAFQQIQTQLQNAMMQANVCIQQATNVDYSKYYAKRPTKPDDQQEIVKTIDPSKLISVHPTCSTYGAIIDAVELNKAKLLNENKKMACLVKLQQTVDQVAQASKAPFQQLADAANQVYQTYQQVIDTHAQIAGKIATDLCGTDSDGKPDKECKGGYKAALDNLEKMALDLNNVLSSKPGQNPDGRALGLVKEVEGLKDARADVANKWYGNIVNEVGACFQNDQVPCFNGISLTPQQCIAAMIKNQATGTGVTGGAVAAAKYDTSTGLPNIDIQNYMNAQSVNLPANIDINDPNAFLNFTQSRFSETLKGVLSQFASYNFTTSIDKNQLLGTIQGWYQACYTKATNNFDSQLKSKTGRYYQDYEAVADAEKNAFTDEKNWLDPLASAMTKFKTQFTKIYSSDLNQFKTDCTKTEDPYQGLDCLRELNAELQSGMQGTRVTTKLSGGAVFVSDAGETTLPIQTLTLDAQGKPTIGSSSIQCAGFDDCVSYLDRTRQQHADAIQSTTTEQQKFVQQNNSAVKSAFQVVSGQFGTMSQLLTGAIGGIETDLANLGISPPKVPVKKIDSEELATDDKTGLYKVPKDMEAAFAGQNAYTEIDQSDNSVTDAINARLGDLNKEEADAHKIKTKCRVTKSDYEAVAKIMPADCSKTAEVCGAFSGNTSRISQLQALLNKSMDDPDEADKNTSDIGSKFNSCRSQVMQEDNVSSPTYSQIKKVAVANGIDISAGTNSEGWSQASDEATNEAKAQARLDVQQQCGDVMFPPLVAAAGKDRAPLDEENGKLVSDLQDVSEACGKVSLNPKTGKAEEEDEGVTSACSKFKEAAKQAQPPTGEDETPIGQGPGEKTRSNDSGNPFSGTAK